jgi:2-oxoglutarate ferredoxin oxidoreductase subunit beta
MLKAAIAHKGTVMLDVISPCVTFNDHEGSTKSYKFMQEHDEPINEIGFVPSFEDIEVEYDHGTTLDVNARRFEPAAAQDPRGLRPDRQDRFRQDADGSARKGRSADRRFLCGHEKPTFTDLLNLVDQPLSSLPESVIRPSKEVLDKVMAPFKANEKSLALCGALFIWNTLFKG